MSRVGKQPISLPNGVTFAQDSGVITIKGGKGELSQAVLSGVSVTQDGEMLTVTRANDERINRGNHGLMRSLLQNMVDGVDKGFEKQLEVNGVGFRVALAGQELKMKLGFSHESVYKLPEGIQAAVDQNKITISGISKQQVGQVAAEIRALKKPEPYKGKGIQYVGEHIIRKSGKSGKE